VQENARPYKIYTALISQSATSDPTATVLENTLGGTIVWTRIGVGEYRGTLSGAFVNSKTACFSEKGNSVGTLNVWQNSVNDIAVSAFGLTGLSADGLSQTSVEIRVYP